MTNYKFKTRVKKIEQMTKLACAWREGGEIRTSHDDLGWYILLEGSNEYLHVGEDRPDLEIGQKVVVTIAPE